jgi:hypothetical protein
MADRNRKLGIPIYDAGVVPDGTVVDDEDILEAEVINDGPTRGERLRARAARGGESVSETLRNARVHGARDTFVTRPMDEAKAAAGDAGPRVASRQAGRAQRDAQAKARADQAADTKRNSRERTKLRREAKTDPLAQLKLDVIKAGEDYMASLRASGILDAKQTKESQKQQLSGLHQVYASMMVLQCVSPLKEGLSSKNLVSALGMGASMWMLSPNFRTQVGSYVGQIGDVIREKIDGRSGKKDAKAQSKHDKLASRGKADQLGARWQKRLDKIEHAERGHRLPFTAQSAAMTEVALAEAAYADMRRPGADRDAIQDRYQSALSGLYSYIDDDGLPREDVSRAMRVIVGQRLDRDPAIANVFSELGHGRFTKSEPREVFISGTTETVTVWTGDFEDSYEKRTISSGSFRLRPPVGVDEHRLLSAETLAAELTSSSTVAEMNDALSQYLVASSVAQYPAAVDLVEGESAQRRFGKARTMFASMAADGLSQADQHFAYSAAYVDAVEIAHKLKPGLSSEWVAQYGADWRDKVAEDVARYTEMGRQAERDAHGPGATKGDAGYWRAGRPFTGRPDWDGAGPEDAPFSTEDIVDAEVVVEDDVQAPRTTPSPERGARSASGRHQVEELVHEGELIAGDDREDVIHGEVVEDGRLGPADARAAIAAAARSTSTDIELADPKKRANAAARVRSARVNQHYNEVETGGIAGIGSDDAAPLQDVDFQLG